jgi:hypothetical protein
MLVAFSGTGLRRPDIEAAGFGSGSNTLTFDSVPGTADPRRGRELRPVLARPKRDLLQNRGEAFPKLCHTRRYSPSRERRAQTAMRLARAIRDRPRLVGDLFTDIGARVRRTGRSEGRRGPSGHSCTPPHPSSRQYGPTLPAGRGSSAARNSSRIGRGRRQHQSASRPRPSPT